MTRTPKDLFSRARRPIKPEPAAPPTPPAPPVVRDIITRLELHADGSATRYVFDPAAPEGERETAQTYSAEEVRLQQPHSNPTPTADLLSAERQLRGLE
jgi:hypothetical protein